LAVEDNHHRHQQRIARQHGYGLGIFDRLGESLAFSLGVWLILERLVVPAVEEVVNLSESRFCSMK
jgi:hypothetical protein